MASDTTSIPNRVVGQLWFSLIAVLVGAAAGIGAVLFRLLIAILHNSLFLGTLSATYDANVHTPPSPWGIGVILVPVIGAVGVAYLVKTFAPEARGHGVPEVMDAVYYHEGNIRPVVAVVKAFASALSIGSGGSVGREGPIIQIGSAFSSGVGQLFRMPPWQRIVLIACGAAGGIAATFNTPVGGILFAVELLLHEVSARTLVPVAIATATATYVGRLSFSTYPSFVIPAMETPYFHATKPLVLVAYIGLGILLGLIATLFIRSIYAVEDFFETHVKGSYYRQHVLGMLAVGVMLYVSMQAFGHYYIEGVGYATVQDLLSNVRLPLSLVLWLFAAKLLATALTLGSGASGGIFSPALFLGATTGTAYGLLLRAIVPSMDVSPAAFAVAGMAGMVGGVTGAAVAAIVMIFEMTLDYHVIVPMTAVVAISYGVRKFLCRDSMYTMKLSRRGHYLPEALHANLSLVKRVGEMMETRIGTIASSVARDDVAAVIAAQPTASFFLVTDDDRVVGFLRSGSVLSSSQRDATTAGQLAVRTYVTVREQTALGEVIAAMRGADTTVALVTDGTLPPTARNVTGVITERQLAQTMVDTAALYADG